MTTASTTPPDEGTAGPDGSEPNGPEHPATTDDTTPLQRATSGATDPASEPTDPGASSPGPSDPDPSDPDPDPQPGATPPPAPSGNRFLLWLRSLGLTRRPGWIGGVCAGIAERLGIDPLIVRGIFVVVAVLGGPALLVYAAAWLLLPDEDDVLPVERLMRGSLDRVHAGIGVIVLASMLPVAQGFWSLGGAYTGATPWAPSTGRALWTAVVLALVVGFLIWVVRRAGRPDATPTPEAPAGVPLQPPQRPADARPSSPEDLAAWREQQEAWKAEREAFRAQQTATAHETARARAEEARLRAHAITAARLERQRLRRAANPRLRRSATLLVLGAAAVAGALASLTASGTTATVVGFAVAALVLGLAIVVAGLLRRRAILLIAASLVTVLTASTASLLPPDRELLPVLSGSVLSNATPGRYAMLTGALSVAIDSGPAEEGAMLDIWQGAGDVTISPMPGAAVRVEATSRSGYAWVRTLSADGDIAVEPADITYTDEGMRWTQTFGDPDAEPFVVRIDQGTGSIGVYDTTEAEPVAGATTQTEAGR